jgi:hypothetical protein
MYLESTGSNHCKVFNWGGATLYDEEFLTYDGGRAVRAEELVIQEQPRNPSPDTVILTNRRILIPRSRYESVRHLLDLRNSR